MAYNLQERFPFLSDPVNILEPGAYQNTNPPAISPNKVAFLSKCPRKSGGGAKIWTDALYNPNILEKIPNCTSFLSKLQRFPYEALSEEDIETILCRCGVENVCECAVEDYKEEIICQGKVQRRLFKGPTPKSTLDGGLSAPSKKDHGFKVLPDGTKIRIFENIKEDCPPFYDARVIESTEFYQGCKWSKWTSKRGQKHLGARPGPADYNIETELRPDAICAEKIRALKRKTSKQFRYIELVQRRDILEGRPGPANYIPNFPQGPNLKWLGPRAERFGNGKYDVKPGPTEYIIKRDFDKAEPPQKPCHAKLPKPAFFGIKAVRFKPRSEEGPSPASYDTCYKPCQSIYGKTAPFGSFTERFKENNLDDNEEDILITENTFKDTDKCFKPKQNCTWCFKSKSIRMKPLLKKNNEPSPADLRQEHAKSTKERQSQYTIPFFSSEGRFQPWYNWIPIHGKDRTPGPAYYCLDKPMCQPAVSSGPICRTRRFPGILAKTPAPNAYKVYGGIENILATHNQKLKDNIANKHKIRWSPVERKKMTLDEQESALLNKSIALLDVHDIFDYKKLENKKPVQPKSITQENKLLRCFLYTQQMQQYF